MAFILALVVVSLLALTGGYLIWYLLKYVSNRKPSASKIQQELIQMRANYQEEASKLVPWSQEEWMLLSAKLGTHKEKKGIVKSAEGTMHSIYHEALLTYQYKQYAGGNYSLLRVQTKGGEYVYWRKGNRVEVFKDGQAYGIINDEGSLLSKNGKETIGRLQSGADRPWMQVQLHDHEVAQLLEEVDSEHPNPRAFEYVTSLAEEDQEKLMALSLPFLIRKRISFEEAKEKKS